MSRLEVATEECIHRKSVHGSCRDLVIWMNEPSPYQDSFFAYLKSLIDVSLDVVYDHDTSGMREELGWTGLKSGYSHVFLRRPRFYNSISTAKRCFGRVNICQFTLGRAEFYSGMVAFKHLLAATDFYLF